MRSFPINNNKSFVNNSRRLFYTAALYRAPRDPRESRTVTFVDPDQLQSSRDVSAPGCSWQSAAPTSSVQRTRRHKREPTPEELRIQQEDEALVDEIFAKGRSLSRAKAAGNNDDSDSDVDSSRGLVSGGRQSDLHTDIQPYELVQPLVPPADDWLPQRPAGGRRRNTIRLERKQKKAGKTNLSEYWALHCSRVSSSISLWANFMRHRNQFTVQSIEDDGYLCRSIVD